MHSWHFMLCLTPQPPEQGCNLSSAVWLFHSAQALCIWWWWSLYYDRFPFLSPCLQYRSILNCNPCIMMCIARFMALHSHSFIYLHVYKPTYAAPYDIGSHRKNAVTMVVSVYENHFSESQFSLNFSFPNHFHSLMFFFFPDRNRSQERCSCLDTVLNWLLKARNTRL